MGDSVVPILSTLSSLRRLALWGTRITVDGLARLRAALPECRVECPDPLPAPRSYLSANKVRAILLGRVQAALRAQGHEGVDGELLLECAIAEWREPDGAIKLPHTRGGWRVPQALDALARFRSGMDLHVVGPTGVDVWVPWLRRGGRETEGVPGTGSEAIGTDALRGKREDASTAGLPGGRMPPKPTHGPQETGETESLLDLVQQIDARLRGSAPDAWRGVLPKEQEVKRLIYEVVQDTDLVELLFPVVKARSEY